MKYRVPVIKYYEWQKSVISTLSDPPSFPDHGDRYLISTSPTGIWVSHENEIAQYVTDVWEYTTPIDGMFVYDNNTDKLLKYKTDKWAEAFDTTDIEIIPKVSGFTLTEDDLNQSYSIKVITDTLFILPEITADRVGKWVRFIKLYSGKLEIEANGNDKIVDSGYGDTIYNDVTNENYANIKLLAAEIGKWILISGHGTWVTTSI